MAAFVEHSPLGGSGAYRWMLCPGSVALSYGIEDEESEYAVIGTAAHALAEVCLKYGMDAWERMSHKWLPTEKILSPHYPFPDDAISIDKEMADAVQVYLYAIRSKHEGFSFGQSWIEQEFHCPTIHKYCWGKSDFCYLDGEIFHVWEYKHGAGIMVEVPWNPQLMYCACGMLEQLRLWEKVKKVELHVVQPRGFHFDGPIRSWVMLRRNLKAWMKQILIPAMDLAMVSDDTKSGEHCRFCPARAKACPQIVEDFDELEKMNAMFSEKDVAQKLSNTQIARYLDLFDVAKIAANAVNKTAFGRMQVGKRIPGRKLVKARVNREWKRAAKKELKKKFGANAMTTSGLKSPSQIEALPGGEKMTARYAFKPDKGLTIARSDDIRMAVDKDVKKLFKDVTK